VPDFPQRAAVRSGRVCLSDYQRLVGRLDSIFVPGREVLIAQNSDDVLRFLRHTRESERLAIGAAAGSAFSLNILRNTALLNWRLLEGGT